MIKRQLQFLNKLGWLLSAFFMSSYSLASCVQGGDQFGPYQDAPAALAACEADSGVTCFASPTGYSYYCSSGGSNDVNTDRWLYPAPPSNQCIPAQSDTFYQDSQAALNQCNAQCVTGQPPGAVCLLVEETPTKHYWRVRENGVNGTAFLWNPQSTGGGNPNIKQCTDPEITGQMNGGPIFPDAQYNLFPLATSEIHAGTVSRDNTGLIECRAFPPYLDGSGEETLECKWTLFTNFDLTDDLSMRRTRYIGDIQESEISSDLNCDTQFSNTQSWDLANYAQTEETTETDGTTETVTEFNCWVSRNYNATSGVTQVCDICQTVVDGTVTNTTEQCSNEAGDTTTNQDGEEGTGQVDSGGGFVPGSGPSGPVTGTDGTGSTPETGGDPGVGGTGSNADVVDKLDQILDQLEEEEGAGECDPESSDYAECAGFVEDVDPGTQDGLSTYTDTGQIAADVYTRLENAPITQAASGITSVFTGTGTCPQPTFSVLGQTFAIDMHCTLITQFTGTLSAIMILLWSIAGIRHLMSA